MEMPDTQISIGKISFSIWDVVKIASLAISFIIGYTNIDKQLSLIQAEMSNLRAEVQDFKTNYVTVNNRINDLDKRVTVLEKDNHYAD